MAQNITLMGANYSAVPAVTLPKTGGGTASFTDVTDTTATASNVAAGSYFYTAAGVRTQGTVTVYNGEHHTPSSGYTVTISLTNPVNGSHFYAFEIYTCQSDEGYEGVLLDTISSPTGSATVTVNNVWGIHCVLYGTVPDAYAATATITGNITQETTYPDAIWFAVNGSGTIILDGIDYDD